MSKIAIAVGKNIEDCSVSSPVLQWLRQTAGGSLLDVKAHIEHGTPFYHAELYLNDHVEVDETIREILGGLKKHGLGCRIWESEYDDDGFSRECCPDGNLEERVLLNMLDEAAGQFK